MGPAMAKQPLSLVIDTLKGLLESGEKQARLWHGASFEAKRRLDW
jgi:hypothetical protein